MKWFLPLIFLLAALIGPLPHLDANPKQPLSQPSTPVVRIDISVLERLLDYERLPGLKIDIEEHVTRPAFDAVQHLQLKAIIQADSRKWILIDDGSGVKKLTFGDQLGSFVVENIAAQSVSLRNDTRVHTLQMSEFIE